MKRAQDRARSRRGHGTRDAWTSVVAVCMLLGGAAAAPVDAEDAPSPQDAGREVLAVGERWFEALLETYPFMATETGERRFNARFDMSIDEQRRNRLAATAVRLREDLGRIDAGDLDVASGLDREALLWQIEMTIEGLSFDDHLLPVSYLASCPPFALAQMASAQGSQPFVTVGDYDDFVSRIVGLSDWVDLALANMRRGIEKGIVQPRSVMELAVERLDGLIVKSPRHSPLYRPVQDMPRSFSEEDRDRLAGAFRTAIAEQALPAYRKLRRFIVDDYLPNCRDSLSLSELPRGKQWYRHLARRYTTTELTPEQIAEIGLAEVERIVAALSELARDLGYRDAAALLEDTHRDPKFFIADQRAVLREYGRIQRRVESRLPNLFGRLPAQRFEFHVVDPSEEAYISGQVYVPASPDGSRPGVFYLTVRGPYLRTGMEALFLHEALPGHHLQMSLAIGSERLPRFRRFAYEGAFIEGWALYAESLGEHLGLYRDRYQRVGRLTMELLRAMRLILDTGVHLGGWSAETASEVARHRGFGYGAWELNRYAAMPGQALAYKIGEMRFLELRREAERAMGDRFDIRAFHDELLRGGPLPLHLVGSGLDLEHSSNVAFQDLTPRCDRPTTCR